MSKNNLLNEGTIRRFMKLANVDALTDTFVEKITEVHYESEEPVVETDEKPLEEMGMEPDAYGARDDAIGDDPEPEEPEEPDVVGVEDEAPVDTEPATVEDLARALLDTIQDLVPGLVDVEGDDDMEPMTPPTDDPMADPVADPVAEPAEEMMEAPEEAIEEVSVVEDEDLINEVAKRVTARLVKSLAARKNS